MAPNNFDKEIQNPNELLHIPAWINEEYFVPILEKNVENFKEILEFHRVAATEPGENYTSIMVRVFITVQLTDGNSKQLSYILKTLLEDGNDGSDFVKSMNLFPKEIQMYSKYLPKFEELYRDAGHEIQLSPKCLHWENNDKRIAIVMEDLSQFKFKNMDRLKGFDRIYSRKVIEKVAELHAASAVYEERYGSYGRLFGEGFFNETNKPMFAAMWPSRVANFEKAMLEWGLDDVEKYTNKQIDFETYYEENMRINRPDPEGFNVLNHGDLWTNNIMFSHDEKNCIKNYVFVDFQLCKWGSPAHDLWYLFTTSIDVDIRIEIFDQLIEIYQKRLAECLKLLEYSKRIPTIKDIQIMLLKDSYWGVIIANSVTPMILFPKDDDSNMDNMLKMGSEADKFRHKVFTSPIYSKSMRKWYPFIYSKGAFDVEKQN
ncbi:uncharacterized protein LOC142220496 isoform X2 [Haematobia irritans]